MGLWNVYTYIQEYLIAYLFCIFFGLLTGDVFNTYCKKRYTNKFVNINIQLPLYKVNIFQITYIWMIYFAF